MKMRKKLAALLAAAMIASVMPMTAFAASSNRVSQTVKVVNDGTTTSPKLNIKMTDKLVAGETFYLRLENSKWATQALVEATTSAAIGGVPAPLAFTVERLGDTELAVTVNTGFEFAKDDELVIALNTKNIKGDATVEVDPWDTAVTAGKYTFATSSASKANVTVASPTSFYTGTNKLAKITIEESALAAFAGADNGDEIEITLDNDDFEFIASPGTPVLGKGFKDIVLDDALTYGRSASDKQKFVLKIKDKTKFAGMQRGTIALELQVKETTRKPAVGEINVDVYGDLVDSKDFKVATIAEYGVELKSAKDYEFVAGKEEKVEFNLNEIVNDTMVEGRDINFTLPEGVYFKSVVVDDATKDKSKMNVNLVRDNDDKYVDGFTLDLQSASLDATKIDKIKFKATLEIRADFAGDVVLKAEGRAIGEEVEVKLATVVAPVTVKVEPMTVKAGIKEQVGGKIVITETDKGRLEQGKDIIISLEKESGMFLTDADVDVTSGDLKKGDVTVVKTSDGAIKIAVKRRSKEASTIEITNVKVKLDRTVPQGTYEVKVGGTAISQLADGRAYYDVAGTADDKTYGNDNITAGKFITVGDPVLGSKAEVTFVIGSEKFLVDGVEMTMDAAAYIKDGRTMVPLRYLSVALGIDEESIKFNSGVVTIFAADGRVIQVQNGNKNLAINGMTIPMVAAAEIIEGRTYVPVTEIGGVFGVAGTWDAASQTATFK